jgi:hypothetical protein
MGHESYERHEEVRGSSDRTLGLVFAAVFVIIGTLPWFFGGPLRLWALIVGSAFAGVALFAPRLLGPLNWFWTRLGLVLHKIVSPVVLGIMFFLVITPMGVVMRWMGKDPLRLQLDKALLSYWLDRTPPGPKPDSLPNQF